MNQSPGRHIISIGHYYPPLPTADRAPITPLLAANWALITLQYSQLIAISITILSVISCLLPTRVISFNLYFLGLNGRPSRPEEILAEMFKALDENQDGFVDIDELKDDMATVLKGETRTPDELMDETDTNGDGNIDFIGGYSRFIVVYENMGEMIHSIIANRGSYVF